MANFRLVSDFEPTGDQPAAIDQLLAGLSAEAPAQVLLGITGSGKTFTVASLIERVQRPTLVIVHNKTLAAQLYGEFKALFPENAVHYFVSYYDYYQPEAYVASSDTFIEKDTLVNDDIDRMRHAATQALLARDDVIIVASVSCIYGIGSVEFYREMTVDLSVGQHLDRDQMLRQLVNIYYERNDYDFHRGTFRVRGDVVEVFPPHQEDRAVRLEFFGDEIESIVEFDPLRGRTIDTLQTISIFPSSHYVTPEAQRERAIASIRQELQTHLTDLKQQDLLVEAQRLEQRTMFDLEMLEQMGFCSGIENYSRHLSGRSKGAPPPTLMDYFPRNYLVVIDESHQTIPQLRAMYHGDRSRKEALVRYGFRLPSALDNRPLKFEEFNERVREVIYVSATPSDYELNLTQGEFISQIIRPTGLLDPMIEVRSAKNQVDDLLEEIRGRALKKERVLVTTLTKRMAEDLTEYYRDVDVRVRYMHSDIDTLERIQILSDLRRGTFDVLVGINLLREGLDLPEVSLVAILDADKEGFLRSTQALIQTIGRAARNVDGRVIMYAERITPSMKVAIDETAARRAQQAAYNETHHIVPRSTTRSILQLERATEAAPPTSQKQARRSQKRSNVGSRGVAPQPLLDAGETPAELAYTIRQLRGEMLAAAKDLEFERAAELRDEISLLKQHELAIREP